MSLSSFDDLLRAAREMTQAVSAHCTRRASRTAFCVY